MAIDGIRALTAHQGVVVAAAVQHIVTVATEHQVFVGSGIDRVIARQRVNGVIACIGLVLMAVAVAVNNVSPSVGVEELHAANHVGHAVDHGCARHQVKCDGGGGAVVIQPIPPVATQNGVGGVVGHTCGEVPHGVISGTQVQTLGIGFGGDHHVGTGTGFEPFNAAQHIGFNATFVTFHVVGSDGVAANASLNAREVDISKTTLVGVIDQTAGAVGHASGAHTTAAVGRRVTTALQRINRDTRLHLHLGARRAVGEDVISQPIDAGRAHGPCVRWVKQHHVAHLAIHAQRLAGVGHGHHTRGVQFDGVAHPTAADL